MLIVEIIRTGLEALVEAKYLRAIPMDPLTKSSTTWTEIYEEQEEGDDSPPGVYDIKSGSDDVAGDGDSVQGLVGYS